METYVLPQVPNQSFAILIDGVKFDFRLHIFNDVTYLDLAIDDEFVLGSYRVTDRGWLLPFKHLKKVAGNFRFEDDNGAYPWYENFGVTCNLAYYTDEEIKAL